MSTSSRRTQAVNDHIRRLAAEQDQDANRVRRSLVFQRLIARLAPAGLILKGGFCLEVRLRMAHIGRRASGRHSFRADQARSGRPGAGSDGGDRTTRGATAGAGRRRRTGDHRSSRCLPARGREVPRIRAKHSQPAWASPPRPCLRHTPSSPTPMSTLSPRDHHSDTIVDRFQWSHWAESISPAIRC